MNAKQRRKFFRDPKVDIKDKIRIISNKVPGMFFSRELEVINWHYDSDREYNHNLIKEHLKNMPTMQLEILASWPISHDATAVRTTLWFLIKWTQDELNDRVERQLLL